MKPVFLDTVGLLALWDTSDQWHPSAEKAFAEFQADRRPLVTTSLVLFECGNAASRRPYRLIVPQLWRSLETASGLVHPNSDDVRSAWDAYRRGDADGAGVVDHVSFIVMRRLGLSDAFTNDRHFRAAGLSPCF